MNRENKKEVLTGFTNKYDVSDPDSLDESQNEADIFSVDKTTEAPNRSLFKWIVFAFIILVVLILFVILLNI
ncbi:MAG: hypothetical protein Q8O32_00330 [bacterium]|nr:hypothetical protein [bacterium]